MAKVTQIVIFDGVPDKMVGHVKEMLRLDIAAYPERCAMTEATVVDVKAKKGKGNG